MAKKVRIGVIGAGRIGRLHAENLCYAVPDAKPVALAVRHLNDEITEWASELGMTCYNDVDKIFNDPDIDAVFICSSTDSHAELIMKACKAKKHIFCEKPIHTDIEKIKECIQAVEESGVKFLLGFVRRFDHNHKVVHNAVSSGKYGRPNVIKITSRDPDHPPIDFIKTSGGIFQDMIIHDFDMARYLSGSEVSEVMAWTSNRSDVPYADYDDYDTAVCMLKFENGALGVIDNTRSSKYGYDQRTEVQMDLGCAQVTNDLENMSMISTDDGVTVAKPTWFFLERYNNAFIEEARVFTDAVLYDKEIPVTGIDGLKSIIIAKAAIKSVKEKRPVKPSEIYDII